MNTFKVIPVIDILNSEAVHAVKGERANYKPLSSKLFNSSEPLEIIKTLKSKYGCSEFYIADLDAIIENSPNLILLKKILRIPGIKLIIDPGIVDSKDILLYSKYKLHKIIIGLETVQSLQVIKIGLSKLGRQKLILSVDMHKGKLISNALEFSNQTPLEIITKIEKLGIYEIILLDLFRVGQKLGGIPSSYLDMKEVFKGNIFVGGGIKDYQDLLLYKQSNFAGVLIATALYDGTINIEKVREFFISSI
ncbi:MAG: HisA/HisF-related TIM barrel protein [Candidatus Thorarchaeota archaeon]